MCKEEVRLLFEQILSSLDVIIVRSNCIDTAQDFILSPDGTMRLDKKYSGINGCRPADFIGLRSYPITSVQTESTLRLLRRLR